MRQSILDATYLSKPKYTSYRRSRTVSVSEKSEETSTSSLYNSPEIHYSDSQPQRTSVNTSFMNNKSKKPVALPSKGSLIVIPPQFTRFIRSNIHNPSYIKSIIGDYYWKELCLNDVCKL